MAKFPRSSGIAKGENPNGFRSIGGAGYSNRDPTQEAPKPSGGPSFVWPGGTNINGDRWGHVRRGEVDSQGGEHDW
jgi:hypothetical protein